MYMTEYEAGKYHISATPTGPFLNRPLKCKFGTMPYTKSMNAVLQRNYNANSGSFRQLDMNDMTGDVSLEFSSIPLNYETWTYSTNALIDAEATDDGVEITPLIPESVVYFTSVWKTTGFVSNIPDDSKLDVHQTDIQSAALAGPLKNALSLGQAILYTAYDKETNLPVFNIKFNYNGLFTMPPSLS